MKLLTQAATLTCFRPYPNTGWNKEKGLRHGDAWSCKNASSFDERGERRATGKDGKEVPTRQGSGQFQFIAVSHAPVNIYGFAFPPASRP